MLYRCRWCERGYCEDCLDWDKTDLLGENLKEYELLGFPSVTQAFYIKCPNCTDHHLENPEARNFCVRAAAEVDGKYNRMLERQAPITTPTEVAKKRKQPPSRAESLTDATTLSTSSSGLSTPRFRGQGKLTLSTGGKRKAAPKTFKTTPMKTSKRLTT